MMSSDSKTLKFTNAYDYTKPVKQAPAEVYGEFLNIPGNTSDATGLRNMTSLAREFEIPKDHRVHFSTLTFKSDIRVMRKAHEAFEDVTAKLAAEAQGDWAAYTLYQPIPKLFSQHSKDRGGNVLGLDRFNENLIMYEPYLKWQGVDQDELFISQARYLRDTISSYAKSINADNDWLYLNYADKEQRPLEGYGMENVQKLRAAAQSYDPDGVFQFMVPGGFKISQVRQTWSASICVLSDGADAEQVDHSTANDVGALAGVAVGGMVALALIMGAILFLVFRPRRQRPPQLSPEPSWPVLIRYESRED